MLRGFPQGGLPYPKRATLWIDEALAGGGFTLVTNVENLQPHNFYLTLSPTSIGGGFTHGVYLAAGRYTFTVLGVLGANRGIVDWFLDGVKVVNQQDWYDATTTYNARFATTVNVKYDGWHTLSCIVNNQNGSSSGYGIAFTKCWFAPQED